MIVITGDTHGDIKRFKNPLIKKLKKGDTLIICGDFGFVWDGSKAEKKILKKLGKKKYNILFVEGMHENYELLKSYPTEEFCGGMVRTISGRLRQLMRGYVFVIEDQKIFAFGGGIGDEHDGVHAPAYDYGDNHPTQDELSRGLESLEEYHYEVDFIVTYDPPAQITEFLEIGKADRTHLNTYLDFVRDKTTFKKWFFGRHHLNKLIPPKYFALFDNAVKAYVKPKTKKNGEKHG